MDRRVGVYVDASNISLNGGYSMRYDVLRDLACRSDAEPQRLNVYLAFDERRAEEDREYGTKARRWHAALRDQGFRVTVKPVKHFVDNEGNEVKKSNADLDMAVDVLTESERLDTVMLVTGDGDFGEVVRALQSRGCRVEVLAFKNVSSVLRDVSDQYINGFLIPGLLGHRDIDDRSFAWGTTGSRVRGICSKLVADDNYGFMSYFPALPDRRIITSAAMQTAYFKTSSIPESITLDKIPSRYIVFEFELTLPAKPGGSPGIKDVIVVSGK